MKRILLYGFLVWGGLLTSCYKDLGNYDYVYPEEPLVTGVKDSVFVAYIGDTLIIHPEVKHSLVNTDNFSYEWRVFDPDSLKSKYYEGPTLKILFDKRPNVYQAEFLVTDHSNGMKYFFPFKIDGRTEFARGTVVLSSEGGQSQLSFIKPDNTLLPRLYEGLHNGEKLPPHPLQLFRVYNTVQAGFGEDNYWIVCAEGDKPGVLLDASTLKRKRYINDNFFVTPTVIKPASLKPAPNGVALGIINGKFYAGTSNTAPWSPNFGMFGTYAAGNYELAPSFIYVSGDKGYSIGYNTKEKQFVRFNTTNNYLGTDYKTDSTVAKKIFNPKKAGIDLLYMQYLNSDASYAYGKDSTGKIVELKFTYDNDATALVPIRKRKFAGADLVRETTKWIGSSLEVIYFTSGDKIYRYKPVNEDLKPLSADFGGQAVSMLKLSVTGDSLITGTEGKLHYLDISTGKNGNILHTVEGIPGAPVDLVIRR